MTTSAALQSYSMRTRHLLLGALLGSVPNPAPAQIFSPSQEYAGVYFSTPDEDFFYPCGVDGVDDTWSLGFRGSEREAPFLKKVTAYNGYPPLTHFIRIRGRLGPRGSYNAGFQTRQIEVDSVLEVKETLEPCAGWGVPAGWRGVPQRISNPAALALSADGSLAATIDNDRQISIWATKRGAVLRKFSSIAKGDPRKTANTLMTFSNDGKLLAVGIDGIVRVWRVTDGKRLFSLKLKDSAAVAKEKVAVPAPKGWSQPPPPNHYRVIQHLVFNNSGTMLATTNLFSSIVWSMKTGKKLAEFNRGFDFRSKLLFLRNGGLIMTADSGRMVLRSYLDAKPVYRPGTRANYTEHVVMSPDGRWLAVHGSVQPVFLWSVTDAKPGAALPTPGFVTGAIAFSPDGNTIAVAGGSNGLYLWNTRTGAPIESFHNFPGPLSRVWFLADGKSVVTFSTFDDRFRIVYVDSVARAAAAARGALYDDSLTAKLPLGPPISASPRTVGGIVSGPDQRAIAGAEVTIANGDAPDSVIARATTSSGGYFSFNGISFRHVLIRVRKPGFAPGVKYIHLMRWEDGPFGIELKADSAGSP